MEEDVLDVILYNEDVMDIDPCNKRTSHYSNNVLLYNNINEIFAPCILYATMANNPHHLDDSLTCIIGATSQPRGPTQRMTWVIKSH